MKKTNSIYFYKIIFTYVIALFHYPVLLNHLYGKNCVPSWYIAVDFFFMASGFLLFYNMDKYKSAAYNAWKYTLHRYNKIWGKYLISFVVTFIAFCIVNEIKGYGVVERILDSVFEIMLLQGIGLNREWDYINPTLWYISVMIIAGYIIYYFLDKHRDVFLRIIAPLFLVFGLSFLYRKVGSLDAVITTYGTFGNAPLIRGICDMLLGVYAVFLSEIFESKIRNIFICKVLSFVMIVFVLVSSLFSGHSTNDFAYLAILMMVVSLGFVPRKRCVVDALTEKLSGITLEIYLVHEVFRTYIMNWIFGEPQGLKQEVVYTAIYLLLITISAIALKAIWQGVCKLITKGTTDERA